MTVHSQDGRRSVISAGCPADSVPAGSPNATAPAVLILSAISSGVRHPFATSFVHMTPADVSIPMTPHGASANARVFDAAV